MSDVAPPPPSRARVLLSRLRSLPRPSRGALAALAILATGGFGGAWFKSHLSHVSPLLSDHVLDTAPERAWNGLYWTNHKEALLIVAGMDKPNFVNPASWRRGERSAGLSNVLLEKWEITKFRHPDREKGFISWVGRNPKGETAYRAPGGLVAMSATGLISARADADMPPSIYSREPVEKSDRPFSITTYLDFYRPDNALKDSSPRLPLETPKKQSQITALPTGLLPFGATPVGYADGSVALVEILSGKALYDSKPAPGGPILALASGPTIGSPRAFYLASASEDGSLRLWTKAGPGALTPIELLPVDGHAPVGLLPESLTLSGDGEALMAATAAGDVYLSGTRFASPDAETVARFLRYTPWAMSKAQFVAEYLRVAKKLNPDFVNKPDVERVVAMLPEDEAFQFLLHPSVRRPRAGVNDPLADSPIVHELQNPLPLHRLRLPIAVTAATLNADGSRLYLAGADGAIRVVTTPERATPERLRELFRLDGHGDVIAHLALSPDGKYLAAASLDGRVRLHDLDAAERLAFLPGLHLPTAPARAPSPGIALSETTPAATDERPPQSPPVKGGAARAP